mmetsp:Transcript_3474/g.14039  ORF Transcript_3474/g.14039 Transcript_3474/m.14039 type:complete len:275 (-) Transcript_3474:252-1076(-)
MEVGQEDLGNAAAAGLPPRSARARRSSRARCAARRCRAPRSTSTWTRDARPTHRGAQDVAANTRWSERKPLNPRVPARPRPPRTWPPLRSRLQLLLVLSRPPPRPPSRPRRHGVPPPPRSPHGRRSTCFAASPPRVCSAGRSRMGRWLGTTSSGISSPRTRRPRCCARSTTERGAPGGCCATSATGRRSRWRGACGWGSPSDSCGHPSSPCRRFWTCAWRGSARHRQRCWARSRLWRRTRWTTAARRATTWARTLTIDTSTETCCARSLWQATA